MNKPVKAQKNAKRRKKLGECLIESGLIDKKTLANALELQKVQKKKIGQVLIDMGVADDGEIAKALARQLTIPLLRLNKIKIPKEIISLVPAEMAENFLLIPIKEEKKGLLVAMVNPLDFYAIEDLRFVSQMPIYVAVASQSDILEAIERYYPKHDLEKDLGSDPSMGEGIEIIKEVEEEDKDEQDLLKLTELPPVVRFANAILADAIKLKASDIHIEPQKNSVIIRYRIDGILREIMQTDKHVHASLVSRIKIISNMDISIRRKPQDGRTHVRYGSKGYDLRVSTIPASYGEKVTIRILDPATSGMALEDLGFPEKAFQKFMNAVSMPQGIILVTGPTGSGKSSTLYACLNRLNSPTVNIITVEDPIEFDIEGINQVQINPKAGITFAAGLRSILRQDPDIVMVGEIRDTETAGIAFQAAQTGHLVLSTLHTNDAESAVIRLLDLGIDAFLISASLIAVVGQRLVRKICQECKVPDSPSPQMLERLPRSIGTDKANFWKGLGCEACQYTGYSGRIGIFEILTITPSLKEIIAPNVPAVTLKKAAQKEGFQSMSMDGIRKALDGLTTIEEVFRVAPLEAEEVPRVPIIEPRVPIETSPKELPFEETPASISSVRPKKILVADDNEVTLKILRHLLEAESYLIITAKDGLEALKLASVEKPDLIVTDLLMPKMDGITLTKKLKSQLTTRYIPIIMLTAKDEVDFEVKGIDAGADDYLTKPVNRKRLLARINRLLGRPPIGET
ncbi:MAG: Flp pilus assembly complex ATPase component TadA [Deltaproteobacteria bacterium]|nr:Flp pilus assembly complex ATPase component TadA [Deltaproteobacteria bacterium]MBW1736323.1 Flp pilus assembly complex ATPase component TadA [Deltaproteobacteria bacterium]MBW2358170.1 Flp pilus assembly complex ATPase component TadA [Deltaproteobacteria bacterium]